VTDPQPASRDRLAAVIRELGPADDPPWANSRAGRLVERWIPGGPRLFTGRRFAVVVAVVVLAVVIVTVVVLSGRQPEAESAPALPPAISAAPSEQAPPSSAAPQSIVVSVVGRVTRPGLVTLTSGSRVADAISAAGGALPGTNDLALDLARRLNDGEQIYVGIPIPPEAAAAAVPPDGASPSGAAPAKVDLNTATDEQLQTLPGVGPAMAQHILTWRSQHGHFDSISQLKDVSGIGDGRYAKLKDLVTP